MPNPRLRRFAKKERRRSVVFEGVSEIPESDTQADEGGPSGKINDPVQVLPGVEELDDDLGVFSWDYDLI